MPVNWPTIRRFSEESGYTENAIRTKIKNGVWLEGQVWIKAPDGRVLISIDGYHQWVEGPAPVSSTPSRPSKSPSPNTEKAGRNSSPNLSPPPLL